MKTYKNCSPDRALTFLEAAPEPVTSKELAAAIGLKRQRAIDVLTLLTKAGRVTRSGTRRGFEYAIAKSTGEQTYAVESSARDNQSDFATAETADAPEVEPVSPVRCED